MIKIIYTLILGITTFSVFSFRKIEQCGIYKTCPELGKIYSYIGNLNETEFDELCNSLSLNPKELFITYLYEDYYKCGFFLMGENFSEIPYKNPQLKYIVELCNFEILKKSKLTTNGVEKYHSKVARKIFQPDIIKGFLIENKEDAKIFSANKHFPTQQNLNLLDKYKIQDFKISKQYISASGIQVNNTKKGVKLTQFFENGEEKRIDFQESLLKHVKKHTAFGEGFVHPFVELQQIIKAKETEKTESAYEEAFLIKELLNRSKIIFTEDEKELLENSKILAVWHLVPIQYSTQKYRAHERKINPNQQTKIPESKTINRILIGYALDKRDNTTFCWVTDLGQDIENLFDEIAPIFNWNLHLDQEFETLLCL